MHYNLLSHISEIQFKCRHDILSSHLKESNVKLIMFLYYLQPLTKHFLHQKIITNRTSSITDLSVNMVRWSNQLCHVILPFLINANKKPTLCSACLITPVIYFVYVYQYPFIQNKLLCSVGIAPFIHRVLHHKHFYNDRQPFCVMTRSVCSRISKAGRASALRLSIAGRMTTAIRRVWGNLRVQYIQKYRFDLLHSLSR